MKSDNIQRHMNVCTKDGGLGADKVQIEQPIKNYHLELYHVQ